MVILAEITANEYVKQKPALSEAYILPILSDNVETVLDMV